MSFFKGLLSHRKRWRNIRAAFKKLKHFRGGFSSSRHFSVIQDDCAEFFGSKLWCLPVDNSRQRLLVDFSIRWIFSGPHYYHRKLTSPLHNLQGSSKNASYSALFIDHQFERFWLTSWAVKRLACGGERCVSLQTSKYAFPGIIQRNYVYCFHYNNFRQLLLNSCYVNKLFCGH